MLLNIFYVTKCYDMFWLFFCFCIRLHAKHNKHHICTFLPWCRFFVCVWVHSRSIHLKSDLWNAHFNFDRCNCERIASCWLFVVLSLVVIVWILSLSLPPSSPLSISLTVYPLPPPLSLISPHSRRQLGYITIEPVDRHDEPATHRTLYVWIYCNTLFINAERSFFAHMVYYTLLYKAFTLRIMCILSFIALVVAF